MKTFTKEDLVSELLKIKKSGWIQNARPGNAGGVGNTLEDLLGIEENNLPIPNASEWELKSQRDGTTALTTLFHMEPSPRALRFVPKILLPKYGWQHELAGVKYPISERSFRQTINGVHRSDRGFMVDVDNEDQKVQVSFDASSVDSRHFNWLRDVEKKTGSGELNPQPYWGFGDLNYKAGTKMLNTFFVQAEMKRVGDIEYYHYNKIFMLKGFSIEKFLDSIIAGEVLIDFDARTGHNHGTKFRLRQHARPNLYSDIQEID